MTTENLTEILPAGGSRKPSPPCFCAVGKPDISRFLHTLAALNGEMLGVDLQVTDIRRKQDGDGKNLFVLDGGGKKLFCLILGQLLKEMKYYDESNKYG